MTRGTMFSTKGGLGDSVFPSPYAMTPTARSRLRSVLLATAAALTACGGGERVRHAGTAADPFLIGMSQCTLTEPWRVQMNADIAAEADKHDFVRVLFKDAQDRNADQRQQVEELVAQGIDCLVISPRETGPLGQVVRAAHERGVKVIVLDREVGHEHYDVFIGGDNRRIGRAAGEWAAKVLGGEGHIVELRGNMTSSPAQQRHQGFVEGLDQAAHPGLKIVREPETDWKQEKAMAEMRALLATTERIDLVFGHNDPAAYGGYLAAVEAGRDEQMKFVGIDALPDEGVDLVRRGVLDATFEYATGGAEAVQTAIRLLRGEKVEKVMWLPTRVFDAESVASGGRLVR